MAKNSKIQISNQRSSSRNLSRQRNLSNLQTVKTMTHSVKMTFPTKPATEPLQTNAQSVKVVTYPTETVPEPVKAIAHSLVTEAQPIKTPSRKRCRNLDNLHVISFNEFSKNVYEVKQTEEQYIDELRNDKESILSKEAEYFIDNLKQKTEQKYVSAEKCKQKGRRKSRRYRNRRRKEKNVNDFKNHWYSVDYKKPEVISENLEPLEEVSDAPFEEGDFEEVEVASSEDMKEDSKNAEIPVGFRRHVLKYLSYKPNLFFKPKIYDLCQRTIVNCLNLQEDESVDVVSEADYETDNANLENCGSDTQVKFSEDDCEVVEEIPAKCNTNDDNCIELLAETNENEKAPKKSEVSQDESPTKKLVISKDSSADLYQGPSSIQSVLDAWNSHLIGVEYVLEIKKTKKEKDVMNYFCVLCDQDLPVKNSMGDVVTSHINSIKHVSNYMVECYTVSSS